MAFDRPWEEVLDGTFLEKELKQEAYIGHTLFGISVKALAKNDDDVLFHLVDDDKYAIVHLTFKGSFEFNIAFPWTKIYDNWEHVVENLYTEANKLE
jgi:hypothetical protein